jgi:transcriptional regulator with XRE-family HTH domain
MSFQDLSARMKAARASQDQGAAPEKPFDHEEAYRLRGKMLGVLLRDARVNADRSIEDIARMVQVTPPVVEAWEYGDEVPSLPQLELLAYYLDVPVSHFWSMETLETSRTSRRSAQQEYMTLRQRMIGALLRQAREESGQSLEGLAEGVAVSVTQLERYEWGEEPIPMHELSVLASGVNKNLNYFLESSSQIGEMLTALEQWRHFNELPADLREFAANPLNVGFIEIALAFSLMPADKLKRVGVSILDITR